MADEKIMVSEFELNGCPEGEVLNPKNPDAKVDAFFKGWKDCLTGGRRQGLLRVIHEDDGPAVEHPITVNGNSVGPWDMARGLSTGDFLWRDYTIRGSVALDSCSATYSADNYYVTIRPRSGLFARMNDLRHYYYFALEKPGDGRLVLYRRSDDDWHVLAEKKQIIVDRRYYDLEISAEGDKITCSCDGQEVFSVIDYAFPRGKAGVRFNTQSRVKNVKVQMSPGQLKWFKNAKANYDTELERVSSGYPKPVLAKTIDLIKFRPFKARSVTLNRNGEKGFLLESGKLVLVDFEGKVIWERDVTGEQYWPVVGEVHAGDSFDIYGTIDRKLTVLDGATGSIAKQIDLPRLGEKDQISTPSWYDAAANLRGGEVARDFIIREISLGGGGTILWAYDNELNLLWKIEDIYPMYGHAHAFAYLDINNDGREEVYAGTSLYSADGELMMRAEAAEEIAATVSYGQHVDAIVAGDFADDPELDPVLFASAGSAGAFAINGITGKTLSTHKVGHAQGCYAGNFHPELPGLSVVSGTRWENFGILNYFSGRGDRILDFQPDFMSQGGPPVNWTGDGREFLLIASTPESLGMYDGEGRKVICFPDELKNHREGMMIADVLGDSRDELIFVVDGELRIYTQDKPFEAARIYKPRRAPMISYPGWAEIKQENK